MFWLQTLSPATAFLMNSFRQKWTSARARDLSAWTERSWHSPQPDKKIKSLMALCLEVRIMGKKKKKNTTRPFRNSSCKTDFSKAIFSTISGGEQGPICTPEDVFCTKWQSESSLLSPSLYHVPLILDPRVNGVTLRSSPKTLCAY